MWHILVCLMLPSFIHFNFISLFKFQHEVVFSTPSVCGWVHTLTICFIIVMVPSSISPCPKSKDIHLWQKKTIIDLKPMISKHTKEGGMVVQQLVLLPHSSIVPALILSSGYCLFGLPGQVLSCAMSITSASQTNN